MSEQSEQNQKPEAIHTVTITASQFRDFRLAARKVAAILCATEAENAVDQDFRDAADILRLTSQGLIKKISPALPVSGKYTVTETGEGDIILLKMFLQNKGPARWEDMRKQFGGDYAERRLSVAFGALKTAGKIKYAIDQDGHQIYWTAATERMTAAREALAWKTTVLEAAEKAIKKAGEPVLVKDIVACLPPDVAEKNAHHVNAIRATVWDLFHIGKLALSRNFRITTPGGPGDEVTTWTSIIKS